MPARRKHWARRTHRLFGISALAFLVVLAVTGVLLNHTDTLGLDTRSAASPLLLRLYGMESVAIESAYRANGHTFAVASGKLYLNGTKLADGVNDLKGAVAMRGEIIVATAGELLLLTDGGDLIERVPAELETPVRRLGTGDENAFIETGDKIFAIDTTGMQLRATTSEPATTITWSSPAALDATESRSIAAAALGEALSVERVIVDLHSGRLLPVAGRYIADLAALSLLYLCVTGGILWFRRRQQ